MFVDLWFTYISIYTLWFFPFFLDYHEIINTLLTITENNININTPCKISDDITVDFYSYLLF